MLDSRQAGILDFKLTVIYDTATQVLNETLTLGAGTGEVAGLVQMVKQQSDSGPCKTAKDILGALLVLAPIINETASALDPSKAGDWAALVLSTAIPAGIAAGGGFTTERITLYGGELRARQFLPPGDDPVDFTDSGVIFDYGVEFTLDIPSIIKSTKPLKVRYKAVGFNLHFGPGQTYQPIFDTSKGYEIDLRDPGLFKLPALVQNILKVLAVRIARVNPVTLEIDLGAQP